MANGVMAPGGIAVGRHEVGARKWGSVLGTNWLVRNRIRIERAAAVGGLLAFGALASPMALAQTATEVPADWSLKPAGLNAGAKFRLLFLSSTKRDGSSNAISDYNSFVQTWRPAR